MTIIINCRKWSRQTIKVVKVYSWMDRLMDGCVDVIVVLRTAYSNQKFKLYQVNHPRLTSSDPLQVLHKLVQL